MRKIVIGLGSGRCATMSLAHLLDSQPDSDVTHEAHALPWDFELRIWQEQTKRFFLRRAEIIGDVGYYWINYVERLLKKEPQVKFICLKRDRQEVIESMWVHSRGLNVHPTDDWMRMYPRYPCDRKTAIGLMWDDYYKIAESLQGRYPKSFRIFDIGSLNTEKGQKEILSFAGIKNPILEVGIRVNKSKEN